MVRQTAKVLVLEVFGALLLLLLLAGVALVVRLAMGPIEITAFKGTVERALADARGGQSVEIDTLKLEWIPQTRRISVTGDVVRLFDDRGDLSASAERAEIDIDATALFLGEVRVEALVLREGSLEVRHMGGSDWLIAGRTVSIDIPAAETFDLRTVVDRINAVTDSLFSALDDGTEALPLEQLVIEGFTIDILDRNGTVIAKLPYISGRIAVSPDGQFEAGLEARSPGLGLPQTLAVSLETDAETDQMQLAVSVSEWSLEALLARLSGVPVSGDMAQGLPVSGALFAEAGRSSGLESIGFDLVFSEGEFRGAGRTIQVRGADVAGRLNVSDETLDVRVANLESKWVSGNARLTVANVFEAVTQSNIPVALTSDRLRVDARPFSGSAWALSDVSAEMTLQPQELAADFGSLNFVYNGSRARAQGRLAWFGDRANGLLPRYSLKASAEVEGPLTKDDVLAFWPVRLGADARTEVAKAFEVGTVSDVTMRFDISPGDLKDQILRDDAMAINFQGDGVRYRFLDDVPPIESATARGRLTGNALDLTLVRGRISNWTLTSGSVRLPAFKPVGGPLLIEGTGAGPVQDVLRVLQNSELALGRDEGFDVSRVTGTASGRFSMQRPTGEGVTAEQIEFSVDADFRDASFTDVAADLDLTQSSGRVRVNQEGLVAEGRGAMAGSDVSYSWEEDFADDIEFSSALSAQAVVTPDLLNRFGFSLRAYLSGEIPVRLAARGNGADLREMVLNFDFRNSRIDVNEIGLRKPLGSPAEATLNYKAPTAARPAFYSGQMEGEGFALDGDIRMASDNRVDMVTLRRAYVASRLDVEGEISRDPVDGIRVQMTGKFLDVSDVFGGIGSFGSGETGLVGDIVIRADVERLNLDDGVLVRDARFETRIRDGDVSSLLAEGQSSPGKAFSARLEERANGRKGVSVSADDASFVLLALFDADFVAGGRLTLDGVLAQGDLPTRLDLNLYDARLIDAPLVTQVLSLASIRGLADTLSGEGLLLSRVELPLTVVGKRFVVAGGRASGPALGMTANGWLELGENGQINLDGVLVPSFGINSALGGVPIIGDLFVSRDGEGVFSLTYSVQGTLGRAQVAINPLSAVTPGVLRRIFENPADTTLAAAAERESEIEPGTPKEGVPPPPPEFPVDPGLGQPG